MAKISIVVNKFIRDIYTSTETPDLAYEKYMHMFEDWSSLLPPNLRYFPDHLAGQSNSTFATIDELSSVCCVPSPVPRPRLTTDSSTLRCSILQL